MTNNSTIVLILLISFIFNSATYMQKSSESKIEKDGVSVIYFEQNPPGNKAKLFANGIISLPDYFEHSAAIYSPDQKEIYWVAKPNENRYLQIYYKKLVGGKWTEKQIAPFSKSDYNFDNPAFSPDGNRIYFSSDRPIQLGNGRKDWDIWFVQRNGDKWSDPTRVSKEINTDAQERAPSITKDGSIYFSRLDGETEYVYVSRFTNGKFSESVKLDKNINSGNIDISVFIDPNEKYMLIEDLLNNRFPSLNISYKLKDNSWSKPINLSLGWSRFPTISPDEKYLFYMTREGIFWVSSSFIKELKPL